LRIRKRKGKGGGGISARGVPPYNACLSLSLITASFHIGGERRRGKGKQLTNALTVLSLISFPDSLFGG